LLSLFLVRPVSARYVAEAATANEVTLVSNATLTIVGRVVNTQEAGVGDAEIRVFVGGEQWTLTAAGEEMEVAHTHADGSYVVNLALPQTLIETER
jgi:hypothetical protein